MKRRTPKERIIYDNYALWETYPDEELREMAIENGWIDEDDEPTDDTLWHWRYEQDEIDWDSAKIDLIDLLGDETVGFFGQVGLWNGVFNAGKIGKFEDLLNIALRDCRYVKIYDENGHLYLTCSHHDGTNHYEIKIITDKGQNYLDRWEYSWSDKRSEKQVHNQIFNKYSRLPRFAEKVYGCKAREYDNR